MANPLTSRVLDIKLRKEMEKRGWELFEDTEDEISFLNPACDEGYTETAAFVKGERYIWEKLAMSDPEDEDIQRFRTMDALLNYLDQK